MTPDFGVHGKKSDYRDNIISPTLFSLLSYFNLLILDGESAVSPSKLM